MYKTILLPTDGSEYVSEAAEHAIRLATLTDGIVHVLYVIDTRDYSTLPESKWLTLESELREQGDRALEVVAEQCRSRGVSTVTATERGVPHEEILAYVDEHDVDIIVMATHGRTGLDHFLRGSVTEKVLHHATVPVVAVHVQEATTTTHG